MAKRRRDPHPDDTWTTESRRIPEGKLTRAFKLGTSLLGAMSRGNDARRLAATLGSMKGLGMKLGQTLSYIDTSAPEAWRAALAHLQNRSTPMAPEVASQVIRDDLGKPPEALFADWDAIPIAAASVGQVHRARLQDGTAVAVKVRYPNVDRVIQEDLANLGLVTHLGGLLAPRMDRRELVEEFRERFLEECDYRKEASHQLAFRTFFADAPAVVVPETYSEYCSERVLTSSFIEGKPFDRFVRTASDSERQLATRTIHNFAFRSIYDFGALNCDPHPGNYLFLDDAVAFLDFGCVRRFPDSFTRTWKTMLRSALEQDRNTFREAVIRIGLAAPQSSFDFDAHYRQYLFLIRPWLTTDSAALSPKRVQQSYRTLLKANPNRAHLYMPRELLFTNRLQWGLFSVLSRLAAPCSFRKEILDILYDPDEPRPPPFSPEDLQHYLGELENG